MPTASLTGRASLIPGASLPEYDTSISWPDHGTPPDLARLVDGDVPATTDFRRFYQRLERDWMPLTPRSSVAVDAPQFLA